MDVTGTRATGRSTTWSATAGAWPARWAGCAWASSAPARPARAAEYADALGIALQQTNILRDIREDLSNGRVYLPGEDLDRFGVRLALDAHGTWRPRRRRWPR